MYRYEMDYVVQSPPKLTLAEAVVPNPTPTHDPVDQSSDRPPVEALLAAASCHRLAAEAECLAGIIIC